MKSTLKILFADDDLKYSLVLKRFLEREGYEVTYTGNGTMALEQFPVVKPDLVLLDINMPGLNGFEVAEKIREQDRHPIQSGYFIIHYKEFQMATGKGQEKQGLSGRSLLKAGYHLAVLIFPHF